MEISNFIFFHRKRQQQSNSTGTHGCLNQFILTLLLVSKFIFIQNTGHCCFKRNLQILAVKLPEIFCSLGFGFFSKKSINVYSEICN